MRSASLVDKPDPAVCPRRFCFCWGTDEPTTTGSLATTPVADGCGCPFGRCVRADPERGEHDWYEPHEPNLRAAGLPWFTFIPAPDLLVPARRAEYVAESEALWGPEHWNSTGRGDEPTP